MKTKKILFIMLLLASSMLFAEVLSVYDIQYTDQANGNSPYSGQTVSVGGIVTAIEFDDEKYFISDREGGPWSGVYVYDYSTFPALGDSVVVTADVVEYYELTEMSQVSSATVESSGNPLPEPAVITCSDLTGADAEQWEGVLVKIIAPTCSNPVDSYGDFKITDTSGASIYVMDGFFTYNELNPQAGDQFTAITGVVQYSYSYFRICPRTSADIEQPSINIPQINVDGTGSFDIPVRTYTVEDTEEVESYSFELSYDSAIISIDGYSLDDSMTDEYDGEVTFTHVDGNTVKVECNFDDYLIVDDDNSLLITLEATAKEFGQSELIFDSFMYNEEDAFRIFNSLVSVPYSESKPFLNIYTADSDKNIFNPKEEMITIAYGAEVKGNTNCKVIISIYNSKGQLENTILNEKLISSLGIESTTWNGKDRSYEMLPPGMYICHLEVIKLDSGKKKTTTQPIVISTEL